MALSTRIGLAAAVVATSGGLLFFGTLDRASAHDGSRSLRLIEAADCASGTHTAQPTNANAGAAGGDAPRMQQTIRVTVPATALLRIDRDGRVVAALTNTGCAPRHSDDIYVVRPDGTVALASSTQITARTWTGDFTSPGVYVDQAG